MKFFSGLIAIVVLASLFLCAPLRGVADAKTYTIKVTHVFNATHAWNRGLERFKVLVEKRTGGNLKVKIYPAAQLSGGNNRTMCEQLQAGTLEMLVHSPLSWAGLVPEPQLFDLPFLYPNTETALEVTNMSESLDFMNKYFGPLNVTTISVWENGFRYLTNSKRPVRTPEDMEGLKIRIPPTPLLIDEYERMGALPVSIPMAELYTSLQQGTVDGQENSIAAINSNRLFEVNKYITLWRYCWDPGVVQLNTKFMQSLPEDLRKILVETAVEVGKEVNALIAKEDKEFLEIFKQKGCEIITLTDEETEAFSKLLAPTFDKFIPQFGGAEAYETLKKNIESASKKVAQKQ